MFNSEAAADEGRRQRIHFLKLNAYDRHKQLVNTYQKFLSFTIRGPLLEFKGILEMTS